MSNTHSYPDGNSDRHLPKITPEEELSERVALSHEERLLAFADLYGRKNVADVEKDRHLEAFDQEMSCLPVKQKLSLHRVYTVKQARLFLDIENNDAKRAVKRMARYWDERFKQFGEEGALAAVHRPLPTMQDFRRVYDMALKALIDPDVDEETRRWAKSYADGWNRTHLERLEQEVTFIPDHEKAALVEVQRTRPDMTSDEHKLLFLRCEDFDPRKASRRLVKYWDFKLDLFGREGALSSFTADDLMRDHHMELSLGFYWYKRGTDAFDRGLFYADPGKGLASLTPDHLCTEKGLLKVSWYMLHAVLEEEKCRKNGIVVLVDDRHTDFSNFNPRLGSKVNALVTESFPVKVKALHLFAPTAPWYFRLLLPFIKWLIGQTMRIRLWVHRGTEEQTMSELEVCGISRDLIPTTWGGSMDLDCLGQAWLLMRKEAGR